MNQECIGVSERKLEHKISIYSFSFLDLKISFHSGWGEPMLKSENFDEKYKR